jgi:H+/Cl- antiporter ClcA
MLAVLAGATNTPLACSILALELFSPSFALMAVIACTVSYLITGNRSVYPTQRITESKISSVKLSGESEIAFAEENSSLKYSKWLQRALNLFKKPNKDE